MSKTIQFPVAEAVSQSVQASEQKVQKQTILEYLKAYGFDKSLSEDEQIRFIQTALAGDLNPFKREIHIAVYGEGSNRKVSIITGYQIYLKRAERTGNLDGWRAWIEGNGSSMKAVVEIFRKDWSHSFTHEVYWEEAVSKKKDGSPTQFWVKQPKFQLRKVAMAQAFRLAFPDELGSLPYETAELPENEAALETPKVTRPVKISNAIVTEQVTETVQQAEMATNDEEQSITGTDQEPSDQKTELSQDDRNRLVNRIETLFEEHPDDFTPKHMDWILNNANRAVDKAGLNKMIAYTEKVIRKATA